MNTEPLPYFIDFEASSLSARSYPIEVAFSLGDGAIESYLINPTYVSYWNDWDSFAESLHKLTQAHLQEAGLSPQSVAQHLNERLDGKVLYSNVQEYDSGWCRKLFDAAGLSPSFKISDASLLFKQQISLSHQPSLMEVMTETLLSDEKASAILNELSAQAREKLNCQRHRAACDVEHLLEVWRLVSGNKTTKYTY